MRLTICKSKASGKVIVPPSKSYAHRLLIAGALSNEQCKIKNVVLSEDIKATLSCIKSLNKKVKYNNYEVEIKKNDFIIGNDLTFNCNESGSTLRFLIPIALTFKIT